MSLDITFKRTVVLDDFNITHNLGPMAEEAGIYKVLWCPEEAGVETAADMIEPLTNGLSALYKDPERFKKYDAPNGWGKYEHFLSFVEGVLRACKVHKDAEVSVSR